MLKRQLDHVTGDLIVSPKSEAEVVRVLKACFALGIPVTPRGTGTGNYGQAMPLSGGVVLSLADMNAVKSIAPGRVVAEPGAVIAQVDKETRADSRQELRMHPSTADTATLAGFIAGGSGGVGSINWGGLRNIGNVLGMRIVTMEAEPRVLDLDGWDLLKVMHAYGTNGIITEVEMPLDAAYDWIDVIVGYDDYMDAVRFADLLGNEDGLLFKEIATVAAPAPHDYFLRHQKFFRREHSVVLLMVAPQALSPFLALARREKAEILFRADTATRRRRRRACRRSIELAWNHTTLQGAARRPDHHLSADPVPLPRPRRRRSRRMTRLIGDEMPGHLEFVRFDGKVAAAGLPIVRYTSDERLDELVRIHEDNGVADLQSAPLHAGGRRHEEDRRGAARLQAGGRSQGPAQSRQDDRLGEPGLRPQLRQGLSLPRPPADRGGVDRRCARSSSSPIRSRPASPRRPIAPSSRASRPPATRSTIATSMPKASIRCCRARSG